MVRQADASYGDPALSTVTERTAVNMEWQGNGKPDGRILEDRNELALRFAGRFRAATSHLTPTLDAAIRP
jgi:hypothetical protein